MTPNRSKDDKWSSVRFEGVQKLNGTCYGLLVWMVQWFVSRLLLCWSDISILPCMEIPIGVKETTSYDKRLTTVNKWYLGCDFENIPHKKVKVCVAAKKRCPIHLNSLCNIRIIYKPNRWSLPLSSSCIQASSRVLDLYFFFSFRNKLTPCSATSSRKRRRLESLVFFLLHEITTNSEVKAKAMTKKTTYWLAKATNMPTIPKRTIGKVFSIFPSASSSAEAVGLSSRRNETNSPWWLQNTNNVIFMRNYFREEK